jgi:hypothetical protein
MATLKSKKMVRGRDLKTPLATSTMDKAKGGPGDGKKKSTKKPYKGPTVVERPGKPPARFKKGEFEKMKGFDRALSSGLIKKTQRGYKYTRDPK